MPRKPLKLIATLARLKSGDIVQHSDGSIYVLTKYMSKGAGWGVRTIVETAPWCQNTPDEGKGIATWMITKVWRE